MRPARLAAPPARCAPALRPRIIAFVIASLIATAGCSDSPGQPVEETPPPPIPGVTFVPATLALEQVAEGFTVPLHVAAPAGDDRLFVVERFGTIRIIEEGEIVATPFLDLSAKIVSDGSERGLLSMAFHPAFDESGFVYVMYSAKPSGAVTVERYTVSPTNGNVASPESAKLILSVPHPGLTHNGGLVEFGPDGMLYISIGDGGGRGDPAGNARNLDMLLGKLLRIDVDAGDPYAIPADNPFRNQSGRRGEIWAYGLRNPWRYAFAGSGASATLYIADVGMDRWEEINVVPAADAGLDFGWSVTEGGHCLSGETCAWGGTTFPVHEYAHLPPCTSLTGGFVYSGAAHPEHTGRYFFADYCLGFLRSIRWDGTAIVEALDWNAGAIDGRITSFGRDGFGEMYLTYSDGRVMRIGAATVTSSGSTSAR